MVSDSPPPPLPPPLKKGYENIGTRSLRRGCNSDGSLTDSAGSLEFNLESGESPRILRKSKSSPRPSPKPSPKPSPRQSPAIPHKVRVAEQYDETVISESPAFDPYDKVQRKQKSYVIDSNEDTSGGILKTYYQNTERETRASFF